MGDDPPWEIPIIPIVITALTDVAPLGLAALFAVACNSPSIGGTDPGNTDDASAPDLAGSGSGDGPVSLG